MRTIKFCWDEHDKPVANVFMGDIDFQPVEVGSWHVARHMESIALLVGPIAYE